MNSEFAVLKARHRAERDKYPQKLSLRVHRALSWLQRAERCKDDDGRFMFLWISFNAAYANLFVDKGPTETQRFIDFLNHLVDLDADQCLAKLVWQQYPGAIRVLLDNQYVYQPFWDHLNRPQASIDWQSRFVRAKQFAHKALAEMNTGKVLGIVCGRLYTLRNQLMHGGATWGSSINRNQLRDANRIMIVIVPLIIEIMMDHPDQEWGEICYPVV